MKLAQMENASRTPAHHALPMPVVIAPLALLAIALLVRLILFVARMVWAIEYPNGLDYGEGIVWEQMRMIVAGHGYGPIDGFPAIVFHYPPVYHLLTWAVAAMSGLDGLAAGRALSAMSTLVGAVIIGLVAAQAAPPSSPGVNRCCGAIAGLVALCSIPVVAWAPYMRVDMLAMALTLGGLYAAMCSLNRPRLIYVAAALFVAAVYTKQTMVAAPAAAFLTLLMFRPGLAIRGISAAVLLGGGLLIGMELATGGGFVRHAFLYNLNRFDPDRYRTLVTATLLHFGIVTVALYGLLISWTPVSSASRLQGRWSAIRAQIGADPAAVRSLICSAYLIFASIMLAMVGKSGASINYLIEWFMVLSIFAGVALQPAIELTTTPTRRAAGSAFLVTLLPLALFCQIVVLPLPGRDSWRTRAEQSQVPALLQQIQAAEKPIISDDMVVLIEGGKDVVWEPAIFAELGATGVYDESLITRMIDDQAFAFFVTEGTRGDPLFDARYNHAVADAMDRNYPRKQRLAGLVLHLPAECGRGCRDLGGRGPDSSPRLDHR